MAVLGMQDVSIAFGGPLVLDAVNFGIERGERVCLLGRNGAGKSTVMKIIAGLLPRTEGEVRISGVEVTGPGPDRACVFQFPGLMPWKTVTQNVELALEFGGVPKSQRGERARTYVDLVGLTAFRDHYPAELSGGMQQRVGLARALAVEPAVLLMDEPFGALDAMTRDLLHDELEQVWKSTGLTIVFVTHNVREAARLSDRIVLLTSLPGKVADEFPVTIDRPRRIDSTEVMGLAAAVTDRLRAEVRRHGD